MLIIDARRDGQRDVPCRVQAVAHFRIAQARGDEWIYVDKPGHTCPFNVEALRQELNRDPRATPHQIVNAPWAEHQRLGATAELLHRNWPGATFQRLSHGG